MKNIVTVLSILGFSSFANAAETHFDCTQISDGDWGVSGVMDGDSIQIHLYNSDWGTMNLGDLSGRLVKTSDAKKKVYDLFFGKTILPLTIQGNQLTVLDDVYECQFKN